MSAATADAGSAGSARGPRRVLFFAEAVTLAHLGRPLALARGLDPAHYTCAIACDPALHGLVGTEGQRALAAPSIGSARFLRRLAFGVPVFRTGELAAYVERDLELIAAERPDVVVGDFRLSLSVSARRAGVPYVALSNAYWSPAHQPRLTVPELPITRLFGVRMAQRLFDLALPLAIPAHCSPLNEVRRRHGLPPLPLSLAALYTDADRVLYADPVECYPELRPPAGHGFVGPLHWSPRMARPDWWSQVPADRPIAFVTLGSSGQVRAVPRVIEACRALGLTVLLASAGRRVQAPRDARVFVADYLPALDTARRAALLVCNGGSPLTQIALAAGKPVLGIPSNLDQHLNMQQLTRLGVALTLRAEHASESAIAQSLARLLHDAPARAAAARFAAPMAAYDPAARFAEHLQELLGERLAA